MRKALSDLFKEKYQQEEKNESLRVSLNTDRFIEIYYCEKYKNDKNEEITRFPLFSSGIGPTLAPLHFSDKTKDIPLGEYSADILKKGLTYEIYAFGSSDNPKFSLKVSSGEENVKFEKKIYRCNFLSNKLEEVLEIFKLNDPNRQFEILGELRNRRICEDCGREIKGKLTVGSELHSSMEGYIFTCNECWENKKKLL